MKLKKKNNYGNWVCKICKQIFETRKLMYEHRIKDHNIVPMKFQIINGKRKRIQGENWNKGQTKETNEIIRHASETYHNRVLEGLIIPPQLNKPLSEEHKKSISEGMKIAHKEGRAHNIGESRWNNEHSWPEKWLIKVLENEFGMYENVNYKTEMPFGKYALDFAWPEQKFCIEIDGEQHERFEEYKLRDEKKDELLKEKGWVIIRIKWKECFNKPKDYIQIIKDKFIQMNLYKNN